MNNNKMKKRNIFRRFCLVTCISMCTLALFAQGNIRVSGMISDTDGLPLPGVNIAVKGTTTGIVSDGDGKYTIQVPGSAAVLVFSYIGCTTQEIRVGNQTSLDVVMRESSQMLDEVVVVGYGTQKKVNLTGAVASVRVDEKLTSRALTNVSTALSGLAPGLSVSQSTGMAGQDNASLLIRGMGTVNDANPLIVVDGMPDVDINRINMNDIESISVLKDATSSAVYGSRAANGVILVTTKSGKGQEKTHIDFTGSYAVAHPVNAMQFMSDYSRAMTTNQRMQLVGSLPQNTNFKNGTIDQWMALGMIDPIRYPNTDWWDLTIRDGAVQNYNLSATGSNEKSSFYASVGIMDNRGLQIENEYSRYNARFNFDYKVKHNINIGFRFDGNWSNYNQPYSKNGFNDDGTNNQIQYAPAGITPYDPETGNYGIAMAYGEDIGSINLYAMYLTRQDKRNRQEANTSLFGEWEIIKGLSARVDYALNYYNQFEWQSWTPAEGYNFQTGTYNNTLNAQNAPVINTTNTGYKTMLNGRLNYSTVIAEHHSLSLMAAYNEEYWYNRSQAASRNDRLHSSLHEIDAALTSVQSNGGNSDTEGLRSYIARLNYVAYDKYLLELNFRRDGSSKFAPGHQWGFFPSFSAGWRFSEEDFINRHTASWLTSGKLRASYGTLGNNSGVGKYEQQYTLAANNYMINGSIVKGFVSKKLVNLDLTWETTAVTNIGLDLGFLDGRLTTELDYYDRLTSDMNRPSEISSLISGTVTSPRTNIGKLRNRGGEINLNWRDRAGQFNYSIGANASYNRMRLEEWNEYLGKGWIFLDMPYHFVYTYEDTGIAQTWQEIYSNGMNTGSAPGDILRLDINGDGQISGEDKKPYHNYQRDRPTTNFALNGYLEWKGIDLTFLFQGTAGRKTFWLNVLNNVNPGARYSYSWNHYDNTWLWDNREAEWPRMGGNSNREESTFWLDNLAYLRLKNLQLGYNLPRKWLQKVGLDHFRIYGSAENLLTLTKYRGLDPEITGDGYANAVYPLVKSFSIGINIGL